MPFSKGTKGVDYPQASIQRNKKKRRLSISETIKSHTSRLNAFLGLLQAMDNFLSALYSFPGGSLSDRIGIKKSLLIFNLVAMCGFALVILIPTWQAVLIGAVLFISWSTISLPATMSLMYKVLPQNKRTMGVSMHSLVRRIPMALGPLVGGLFISIWGERESVRFAFVAAFFMANQPANKKEALNGC